MVDNSTPHSEDTTIAQLTASLEYANKLLSSIEGMQNTLANAKRRHDGGLEADLTKALEAAQKSLSDIERQVSTFPGRRGALNVTDVSGCLISKQTCNKMRTLCIMPRLCLICSPHLQSSACTSSAILICGAALYGQGWRGDDRPFSSPRPSSRSAARHMDRHALDMAALAAMRAPFLCFQSARMGIAAFL